MASTKTLPAASLTGALPAISAAALTSIPAGNLTGTVADARISTLTASKLTGALPAISGANLTGVTSVGGATGVDFNDNVNSRWGTGNDLRIYHDASHSYVNNQGTGDLLIRGDDVKIQDAASGHNMGVFVEDGGVELYHNNVKKFETTSAGGTLTGTWTGAGRVLQVVPFSFVSGVTSTSSTYAATGITQNITPSSTSNKVLVQVMGGQMVDWDNDVGSILTIYRGSTDIKSGSAGDGIQITYSSTGSGKQATVVCMQTLDSPSTTSSTTYTVYFRTRDNGNTSKLGWLGGEIYMTLTEIAG
jgi:hypothetical protein